MPSAFRSLDDLTEVLRRIDGRGYRAYQDLRGAYVSGDLELNVDHVQGDPFAAPSRLRTLVPMGVARLAADLWDSPCRARALADFVLRAFVRATSGIERRRGSGRSGQLDVDRPGQEVLARSACRVSEAGVELRFSVGLPAAGRRVLGREARELLLEDVPAAVREAVGAVITGGDAARGHVEVVEDQQALRAQLRNHGLVAFVADGSLLPRRSGIDARPMNAEEAVLFETPPSLAVTLQAPHRGPVRGMGVRAGVTLIVGGGYHGKSTLLDALELGIYDHRPGDGRELVVSDPTTAKIRAEDGRRVERVNISPFISGLPRGRDTRRFSSEDASGSTSQAASLVEALEAGAKVVTIDEDTAATNFMIRDRRMQALVSKEKEPITPFVDKVRQLHRDLGVSTILVMGGSGDYFDVADTVVAMTDYLPEDVSARARAIAETPTGRRTEGGASFGELSARVPLGASVDASKGRHPAKIAVRGSSTLQFGSQDLDLSALEQLVAPSQLRAIGRALHHLARHHMTGRTVAELMALLQGELERGGLDAIDDRGIADYAAIRPLDVAAALNRLRTLEVKS